MSKSKRIEINITIPNETKHLAMIGRIAEGLAYSLLGFQGNRRELAYHLNLVLTEAAANAICHGNEKDPDKIVKIYMSASDHDLVIRVYDQGQGFDSQLLAEAAVEEWAEGGRGLQLILKLMDHVEYKQYQDENVLTMIKNLS